MQVFHRVEIANLLLVIQSKTITTYVGNQPLNRNYRYLGTLLSGIKPDFNFVLVTIAN